MLLDGPHQRAAVASNRDQRPQWGAEVCEAANEPTLTQWRRESKVMVSHNNRRPSRCKSEQRPQNDIRRGHVVADHGGVHSSLESLQSEKPAVSPTMMMPSRMH
jgi:hypothetical protein